MLKIIFDTNTLISAIGWGGIPYYALIKAIHSPDIQVFITQTIYDELEENFKKDKFKKFGPQYETFKMTLLDEFIFLKDSRNKINDEYLLSGKKDRKIYRTAVINKVDFIITGDKPFLNSGISETRVVNPKSFYKNIIDMN